ncbi:hypothetical protein MPER_12517 [Moniliophthora perniciosa FA553]|nr:hypothetical protein MPER_12517 [Moniliophthora perniciosa FA553]
MLPGRLTTRLLGRRQQYFFVSKYHTTSARYAKVTQRFKLADIGEGITECEVIKWNVKPKSSVQAFDPLCEVQSDKASVEITSPFDGVVTELLVQEGEVAKVGSGLCLIEVDEEVASSLDSKAVEPVGTPAASISKEKEAATKESQSPRQPEPEAKESTSRRKHPMDPTFTPEADGGSSRSENVLATPSVRHFAHQNGVDLSRLAPGSGRDGRIEKRDVEAFLAGASKSPAPSTSVPETRQAGEDVVVELGRTRYGMWKAMEKSLEIPHFGYSTTLDLTALDAILPTLNASIPLHCLPIPSTPPPPPAVSPSSILPPPSPPPVTDSGRYTKLTYLPFLLKTLSKSMMEWPLLRSFITAQFRRTGKPTLTVRPQADIAIALSTPTGLYTPTIQAANSYSVYGLASQLKYLSHLGRQTPCGLTPKEMPKRGGTLTVSNVGAIGAGDFASPVLVPGGGVAIVAIGRAKWVWDVDRGDGKGERRLKVGISWSADHRVVEGAELAAFVECWREYVERPERLIGDSV